MQQYIEGPSTRGDFARKELTAEVYKALTSLRPVAGAIDKKTLDAARLVADEWCKREKDFNPWQEPKGAVSKGQQAAFTMLTLGLSQFMISASRQGALGDMKINWNEITGDLAGRMTDRAGFFESFKFRLMDLFRMANLPAGRPKDLLSVLGAIDPADGVRRQFAEAFMAARLFQTEHGR